MALGAKNLTIYPYSAADVKNDQFNAYASPTDLAGATIAGGSERSGKDGSLIKDGKGNSIPGTGAGSDSVIHFSSSTWFSYIYSHKGHTSGAQPDEILLHEMVHAMRQMAGVFDTEPLAYMFDTEEEFFAVVVADVYASELKRTGDVRSDHHGFDQMASTQDTSATFLPKIDPSDYKYRLIDKMVRQEPQLCRDLAAVVADFNPFRRYYELRGYLLTSTGASQPRVNPFLPANFNTPAPVLVPGYSRPAGSAPYKPLSAKLRLA